jgi:ring-1,2-phenylacetyl-CoA epoxidase subunit PaaC
VSDALVSVLTALGDDELILGHRHSEWTGFAPQIEEDVAFSSIAQDEIGHAAAYYAIAGTISGNNPDHIGLGRPPHDYRNAIVCELENRDWAYTLARHWLYDVADDIRLESFADSSHDQLRALATKLRREERYHLIHADAWISRVAGGPVEARTRLLDALSEMFPAAMGLFEPFDNEAAAVKEGVVPVPSDELGRRFVARAGRRLEELSLPTEVKAALDSTAEFQASSSGDLIATGDAPSDEHVDGSNMLGGRRGRHSEVFTSLWDIMTKTYREHEGASW